MLHRWALNLKRSCFSLPSSKSWECGPKVWLECSLDYLGVQRDKLRVLSVLRKHSITESHPQLAWCVVFLSFFFKRFITYVCPHLFTCLCAPPATAGGGGARRCQRRSGIRGHWSFLLELRVVSYLICLLGLISRSL